jgi:O-antigen/teichoic acid export membrane protein
MSIDRRTESLAAAASAQVRAIVEAAESEAALTPDAAPPSAPTEGEEAPPTAVQSRNASGRVLAANAISGYVILFASALVGFVCTPLLLHSLGEDRFGVYSLLVATAAYLALVELGFGTATITRVANAEHTSLEAVSEVVSTSISVFTLVGTVVALLVGVVALILPEIYQLPGSLTSAAQAGFITIGVAQSVTSGLGAWTGFLVGTGRMYVVNVGGGIISMMVSIATVVVAEIHPSLFLLGLVQLDGALATLYLYRRTLLSALAAAYPSLRRANMQTARILFQLGWRNSVSSLAGVLAYGSDLVLVGILLAPKAVAAYAIALRGYNFMQNFANGALGAFGPAHAHQAGLHDSDAGFDMYAMSLIITLALALAVALPVLFFAHGLLALWLTHAPNGSSDVVRIFSIVLVLQCFGGASAILMIHYERPGEVMRITTLSAAINVVASIVLTKTSGVTGPALGTVTALALVEFLYFPNRACRLLGRGVPELLTRTARSLLLPTVVFTALLWGGHHIASHGLIILPMIIIAVLAFVGLGWFTPMAQDVRTRLVRR